MDMDRLLSWLPAWLGFLLLIVVGVLMVIHGAGDPLGVGLSHTSKVGFITFGAMAVILGTFSWIAGGTSAPKGKAGKLGIEVAFSDLPWWAWLVDGLVLVATIAIFVALTA